MVGLGRPAVNSCKEAADLPGQDYGGTIASLIAWTTGGVGVSALSCMKLSLELLCEAKFRSEAQLSVCDDPVVGSYFAFNRR